MKCVRMKDEEGVARVSNDTAAEAVTAGEVVLTNKQSYKRKMLRIKQHERRVEAWGRGVPFSASARRTSYLPSRKKGMI